ncbi:hypothetical protein LCGC14_2365160, partial [marine sediment metagenome]
WIMIHSGSRNLGKQVADHYNKIAKELNAYWFSSVPKEFDLAFLPIDSDEGQAYIREMQYCIDFALINRKLMMERVKGIFSDTFGVFNFSAQRVKFVGFGNMINVAHNYAALENHFGKNVWVHRKGAIRMRKGEIGIIPGSQGTASYIVEGLENAGNFKAGKFVGGNPGITETTEEISGVTINPMASGWKNIGTKGIDIAREIDSVEFDLTVAQESQPVTGKALKEATNNVGFAIASGSPSVPDVSRTNDGPLTLNSPTTGSGLTLTLYVRVQFNDTALTKVRGTLIADKATPISAANIT